MTFTLPRSPPNLRVARTKKAKYLRKMLFAVFIRLFFYHNIVVPYFFMI